jgi:signal recognition particle receptor subunit beta
VINNPELAACPDASSIKSAIPSKENSVPAITTEAPKKTSAGEDLNKIDEAQQTKAKTAGPANANRV